MRCGALRTVARTTVHQLAPRELVSLRNFAAQPSRVDEPDLHWRFLSNQGHKVNPCNSRYHPAVQTGLEPDAGAEEVSLQEAYTPLSQCFGCGPANPGGGLGLRSFRAKEGLIAHLTLPGRFQCFPGIVQGGVIGSLFECHGNWTAAVALMDASCLPRPPLTVTYELLVSHKEPTPPDKPLVVRSKVLGLAHSEVGKNNHKSTVRVELTLHRENKDGGQLLSSAIGIYKKLGGLRAL